MSTDWTECSEPPEESCSDAGCPQHGWEHPDAEDCWHCGTSTPRGCDCFECYDNASYVPPAGAYHCKTCGRWWEWKP